MLSVEEGFKKCEEVGKKIDEFLEEYAISETYFKQVMNLLNVEPNLWNLVLTKDEMTKMEAMSI